MEDAIYNADKTGFRIGVGADYMVVTRRGKAHRRIGIPENRELATCIETVSAGGDVIPAFIILAAKQHQGHWYRFRELYRDTAIRVTETGYSNDKIAMDWIQHFEKHSAGKQKGIGRFFILEDHGSHYTKQCIE